MDTLFIYRDDFTHVYGFINYPILKKACKTFQSLETFIHTCAKQTFSTKKYIVVYKCITKNEREMEVYEIILLKKKVLNKLKNKIQDDINAVIDNYGVPIWKKTEGFIFTLSMICKDSLNIYKDLFELFETNMVNADGYIVVNETTLNLILNNNGLIPRGTSKYYALDKAMSNCNDKDILCSFNQIENKERYIQDAYQKQCYENNPSFKMNLLYRNR